MRPTAFQARHDVRTLGILDQDPRGNAVVVEYALDVLGLGALRRAGVEANQCLVMAQRIVFDLLPVRLRDRLRGQRGGEHEQQRGSVSGAGGAHIRRGKTTSDAGLVRADEAATAPITVVQPRVERPSCCGSREAVEAAEKELAGRRAQIMVRSA